MITKFRAKKPAVVEAQQWDGTANGATSVINWVLNEGGTAGYVCSDPGRCAENDGDTPHSIRLRTLEGVTRVGLGDWIIRGTDGGFSSCSPDAFVAMYEPVPDLAEEAP